MLRKSFCLFACMFAGVAWTKPETAKHYEAFYAALQAEFALQQQDYHEAYQDYWFVVRTKPSPEAAQRLLKVAWLSKNKQWQAEALQEVLKISPDDLSANQHYLLLLAGEGKAKQAQAQLKGFFRALQKHHQNDYKAYRTAAAVLSRVEDNTLAEKLMQAIVAKAPNTQGALDGLALYYRLRDDHAKAERYISQSYKHHADKEDTVLLYADILYTQGSDAKKNQATALLEKSHAISGNIDQTLVSMYMGDKHYAKAAKVYQRLAQRDKEQSHKWQMALGTSYILADEITQARKVFQAVLADQNIRKDIRNHANYSLGLVHEEQGEYDKAIAAYSKVDEGEHYFSAKIRQAGLLAENDDTQQALSVLDNIGAVELDDYASLLLVRATVFEAGGAWQKAYDLYTEAIEMQPEGVEDLYYARALLAEKMGNITLMEQDLLFLIERDEDSHEALNALGYSLTEHTSRYEEALGYVKRALDLKPDSFYILDSMGWVLYKLGKYDDAIVYLKKAYAVKKDAEIAPHLAVVLGSKCEKSAAREYLQQAEELDAENAAVQKAKEILRTQLGQ